MTNPDWADDDGVLKKTDWEPFHAKLREGEPFSLRERMIIGHLIRSRLPALRKAKADGERAGRVAGLREAAEIVARHQWSPKFPEPTVFELLQSPAHAIRARANEIERGA